MARVLYIDSDNHFTTIVSSLLEKCGYEVSVARSVEEAYRLATVLSFGAAIVDEKIKGSFSGPELCYRLREKYTELGIIYLLSARENIEEMLKAYEMGVDECMEKMPSEAEFRARLAALIRRSSIHIRNRIAYGCIELEAVERTVTVKGSPVNLTPMQFRMLDYILRNVGRIIAPSEFKRSVFKSEEAIDSSKLRVHICDLRRRLGSAGRIIESVRGKGYGVGVGNLNHRYGVNSFA